MHNSQTWHRKKSRALCRKVNDNDCNWYAWETGFLHGKDWRVQKHPLDGNGGIYWLKPIELR